ncbi:endolytic transglycosylase MltG [Lederbergia galactosidilytica]|uniref:Uncharacterized protein n=1 Tax=Lederbergia galactosidilytica TaxID=217031 RepID=A0A0Q9XM16_9BACI|nr:endolytic transglycosylase MltG [Lederbergia galactosidilytica]KRG09404.1 hypothetical protein ACA29_23765 [Lederbergia galactosidilytica]KRG16221.1 hypothetical protein ACA30_02855 [Virgibacillus soli]MBP1914104.1 mannitol-specific phosphotransferase system IIBC component [Lederbergia galactosidilytica]OAK75654.1 hypothetical protein ABB05_01515 [Lederbergia galactosidilytica]
MSAKSMRSFAFGLIIAACLSGIAYYSTKDQSTTKEVKEPSVEEMTETLASEGYVIHTEEEWREQLAAAEKAETEEKEKEEAKKEEKAKEEPKEAVKEKIVYRTTVTVTKGMTSIDVGEALKNANIIKNPMDFVNEVEKQNLSQDLKPGSYEVDSNMKLKDVISVIFKK